MSSYQLIFPGVEVFWCCQVLDLSLLPLVFSLILTVASRILHPYSTDDKTSRLMVKQLSTVRDTQRGSQSYMKKRRGRTEIEVTRKRRERVKKGERNLVSNQFPKRTPQSGTPREIHRVTQKREGGGRRWRRPGGEEGVSKGERQVQPVISSLNVLHSPKYPKRFTNLFREGKGEGRDRGDLGEKKEIQKGERAIKPVIILLSKNGYCGLDS